MKQQHYQRLLKDYDTIVQCKKCFKKQYLRFVNGLKNGWSQCCGYTMPIIYCDADIDKAVESIVNEAKRKALRSKDGKEAHPMTSKKRKKKRKWLDSGDYFSGCY